MSSTSYDEPLRLNPRYSRFFFALMAAVHIGAAIAVLMLPWDQLIIAALVAIAFMTGVYGIRRFALLQTPDAVVSVVLDAAGEWNIFQRNGHECRARLEKDTYISQWLVVLNFYCDDGKRLSLVLWPDMLEKEKFRQLRVRLITIKKESL